MALLITNDCSSKLISLLFFVSVAVAVGISPIKEDVSPAKLFDVTSFGAKPDGKTDCTEAFNEAWNATCQWNGNRSMLMIPSGKFLVGPIRFEGPCKNTLPITVNLKGIVIAPTDLNKFSSPEWFTFDSLNQLILTGGGTFDGQGALVWKFNDCKKNNTCRNLPTSIKFNSVRNANISSINSINSKQVHMGIHKCQNITAHDLHITAPGDSPNTDGIHISASNEVTVYNSVIGTGDDCISIGPGSIDVSIINVTCGPGHGISVGSLGKDGNKEDVRGITVKNCTLSSTTNGVRIKTWAGSSASKASSFIFEDIIMNDVENPIIIDQQYCPDSSSCSREHSLVKIADAHYRNIRGTSASQVAVNFNCSQKLPCQDVELVDINLKYNKGKSIASCSNVEVSYGGVQIPPPCKKQTILSSIIEAVPTATHPIDV